MASNVITEVGLTLKKIFSTYMYGLGVLRKCPYKIQGYTGIIEPLTFRTWLPSINHSYNLNIDASATKSHSGLGLTIRDGNGDLRSWKYFRKGTEKADVAEAMAAAAGLRIAYDAGLKEVQLFTDNLSNIEKFRMPEGNNTSVQRSPDKEPKIQTCLTDVKALTDAGFKYSIDHIYRGTNHAADFLSTLDYKNANDYFKPYEMPKGLQRWITHDKEQRFAAIADINKPKIICHLSLCEFENKIFQSLIDEIEWVLDKNRTDVKNIQLIVSSKDSILSLCEVNIRWSVKAAKR